MKIILIILAGGFLLLGRFYNERANNLKGSGRLPDMATAELLKGGCNAFAITLALIYIGLLIYFE